MATSYITDGQIASLLTWSLTNELPNVSEASTSIKPLSQDTSRVLGSSEVKFRGKTRSTLKFLRFFGLLLADAGCECAGCRKIDSCTNSFFLSVCTRLVDTVWPGEKSQNLNFGALA